MTEEHRQKLRDNLNENVRPKAIEWHKSEEGRKWHKEQWKISLGNHIAEKVIMTCLNCGVKYESVNNGTNKFCSNNCKSAYRRKLGVDNVERKCQICGDTFIVNKYAKRKNCDKCWHRSKNGNQMY